MSLLIKGVQVVDGEGKPPYLADVLVQKNVIGAIGNFKNKQTDEVIDGLGNYLMPGFIDVDTDSDHYLDIFTHPSQTDFTSQGVTTIIGGHCGSSLAPLLYGTLEGLDKWADPSTINVNWHTMAEFLSSLDKLKLGVNFGSLVGYSTVRRALTGDNERALTHSELAIFKEVVSRALREGAFGLSTGLGYVHGRTAKPEEIKELVSILKNFDAVYATHLRNQTDRLLASVRETIDVASATGVQTLISHLRPLKGYEDQYIKALELIEHSAAQASIFFDVYPHDTSIYSLYSLLPREAQKRSAEATLEHIAKPKNLKTIEKNLAELDPDNMQIASAPKYDHLVGKTIRNVAEDKGITPAKALLELMRLTSLKATVFYKDVNLDLLTQAMVSDRCFIASNGHSPLPGKFMKHERSTNTFPKFLEMASKLNLMPIEKAVKKITSLPAKYFDLNDRGAIKEGKIADLALVGKDDLKVKEVVVGGERRGAILRHQNHKGKK
ncbi:MAG: amidohydrolase family protein [Patescibacteria group bacterium]|nr:amidohydrolase family protein [Patescibacteria group bacterium]MCL5224199.1 amidohydrolase family protein [Patescibacteria group bacterium]